jgi:hypothetical protein
MRQRNFNDQAPIFRFLNKYKWMIMIPVLITTLYMALPPFLNLKQRASYSSGLFITSSKLDQDQLNKTVRQINGQILSDEFILSLIIRHELFSQQRAKGIDERELAEKFRAFNGLHSGTENLSEGASVTLWLNSWNEDAGKLKGLADEIIGVYEANPDLRVFKYTPAPKAPDEYQLPLSGVALIAFLTILFFSLPLILLMESPSLFYSLKTKETVFDPIRADWQDELAEAKQKREVWKAVQINIRYSFAFVAAMLLKSPLGDLIELVRKIAR